MELVEVPQQRTMTGHGPPSEVIGPFMYLLHERHLGVEEAVISQYPVDLCHRALRINDVLEHRLQHDRVEGLVGKGELVHVAHHLRSWPEVDVRLHQLYPRALEELFQTEPHIPASHDQDPAGRGRRFRWRSKELGHAPEVRP